MSLKKLLESYEGVDEAQVAQIEQIFEAAVDERAQVKLEQIEEGYKAQIEELREENAELAMQNESEQINKLAESLDTFLENAVAKWANDNSVALQESAIVDGAAKLLSSISESVASYNTPLPEGDSGTKLEESEAENALLRSQLNDTMAQLHESTKFINESKRKQIVESVIENTPEFSELSKARFTELCEGATFIDEEQFTTLAEGMKYVAMKKEGDKPEDDGKDEEDKKMDEGKHKMKEGATGDIEGSGSKQKPDGTLKEGHAPVFGGGVNMNLLL